MKLSEGIKKATETYHLDQFHVNQVSEKEFTVCYGDTTCTAMLSGKTGELSFCDVNGNLFQIASTLQISIMIGEVERVDGWTVRGTYACAEEKEERFNGTTVFVIAALIMALCNEENVDLSRDIASTYPIEYVFLKKR